MATERFPKSGKRSKMKGVNSQIDDKRLSHMGDKVKLCPAPDTYDRIYGKAYRKQMLGVSQYPTSPDPDFEDESVMGMRYPMM